MDSSHQETLICCLRTKTQYKLVLFTSFILIACKILVFFHPHWFYQGTDSKKWKGGLLGVYSSGGLISEKSYPLLGEYYCAEKSNFASNNAGQLSYNDAERLCSRFYSLGDGMVGYIATSVLGLILWFIATVVFAVGKGKSWALVTGLILICFDLALEFASLICVVASSDITFEGNCKYLSSIDTTTTTITKCCGDDGALFAVIMQLVIMAFQTWNIFSYCTLKFCPKTIMIQPKIVQKVDDNGKRNEEIDKPD